MTGGQQLVLWTIVAIVSSLTIGNIADAVRKIKVARYTGKQERELIDYDLPGDKKL